MTVHTAQFGAPVADMDDALPHPEYETCAPAGRVQSIASDTAGPRPSMRTVAWLLAAAAMLTGTAIFMRWLATGDRGTIDGPPPEVAGFAELYVATILTAAGPDEPALLAPFGIDVEGVESFTPYDRYVTHAAVVDVTRIGIDYWSVVVGAEVLPRGDDGYQPGRLEFYAVGVAATPGGLVATGPPLPVPAPRAAAPRGVAADLFAEADEATVRLVEAFLDAYFTGDDRLPRLVTEDAAVVPLLDGSTTVVQLAGVRTGTIEGADWATAIAVVTREPGGTQPVAMSMRIVSAPGGLRIAEMVPGSPPLRIAPD